MTREEKYETILLRLAALPVLINIDKDKKNVAKYKSELESLFKKLPIWASARGMNREDMKYLDQVLEIIPDEIL